MSGRIEPKGYVQTSAMRTAREPPTLRWLRILSMHGGSRGACGVASLSAS